MYNEQCAVSASGPASADGYRLPQGLVLQSRGTLLQREDLCAGILGTGMGTHSPYRLAGKVGRELEPHLRGVPSGDRRGHTQPGL